MSTNSRSGFTLIEVMVTSALFSVVLLSSMALMERDVTLSQSTLTLSALEDRSQLMLHSIEREMADALIASPTAFVTSPLASATTTSLVVDSTRGFPEQGVLLLSRGQGSVEILSYDSLGAGTSLNDTFDNLDRGIACTTSGDHPINMQILWAGLAEPISNQVNPAASEFDGIAEEQGIGVFYRGAGAGISYRTPIDPTGGTNFLSGEDIQWGSTVNSTQITSGWSAIEFVPTTSFTEAETGDDINNDGDTLDTFDIGSLRRRSWDTDTPGADFDDLGLGPTAILQEQCNWGSDLDGDGFNDPLFLWDSESRILHIRLFLIGRSAKDMPIVREVESVVFLRNRNGL